jgi:hypothetical protein
VIGFQYFSGALADNDAGAIVLPVVSEILGLKPSLGVRGEICIGLHKTWETFIEKFVILLELCEFFE